MVFCWSTAGTTAPSSSSHRCSQTPFSGPARMAEPLADEEVGAAALIEWGEPPLGIAFYPDLATKADLITTMSALASPRDVFRISRAEDALSYVGREALVIVEPE